MKEKWILDSAVLLVFFIRDETFEQVFEKVKEVKPKTLLLWQDGPRNDADLKGIKKCREIAEDINWDCTVYKYYNEKNLGCDPSTFYAFKWAFSIVDKCIILEDDQMPSKSYFYYCKELLDKYENDERISHICGYNIFGESTWLNSDYLFSYTGSGAWASWKRVAKTWEEDYDFLNNEIAINNLRYKHTKRSSIWLNNAKKHKGTGKAFWESIVGMSCLLNSRYAIIPKYNLVKNLGISDNATHTAFNDLNILNKEEKKLYTNECHEINLPLNHPKYIIADKIYDDFWNKRDNPSKLKRMLIKFVMLFNIIRLGKFQLLINLLKRKLKIRG